MKIYLQGKWRDCSTEYHIFVGINKRCGKHEDYLDVENLFVSFAQFLDAVGLRPSFRHSVDRTNPFDHYRPGNVRWATAKEQLNNTRRHYAALHPEWLPRLEEDRKRKRELRAGLKDQAEDVSMYNDAYRPAYPEAFVQ